MSTIAARDPRTDRYLSDVRAAHGALASGQLSQLEHDTLIVKLDDDFFEIVLPEPELEYAAVPA